MYVVKRKSSWLERSFLIIGFMGLVLLLYIVVFSPEISAQSVGQVHLQQESVQNFYEENFPEGSSYIIPSASDAVQVSVFVLENLHLSVADGQPTYGTNWKFGATLHQDYKGDSVLIWTVAADY